MKVLGETEKTQLSSTHLFMSILENVGVIHCFLCHQMAMFFIPLIAWQSLARQCMAMFITALQANVYHRSVTELLSVNKLGCGSGEQGCDIFHKKSLMRMKT